MAKKLDHEKRIGKPYARRKSPSEEVRKRQSEAMKEFHRRTRLGTIVGNKLAASARPQKEIDN